MCAGASDIIMCFFPYLLSFDNKPTEKLISKMLNVSYIKLAKSLDFIERVILFPTMVSRVMVLPDLGLFYRPNVGLFV